MKTPADTTTTIAVSVCPRCGTIEKSGKKSCCGRGGSWFRNCGGVGNTKLHHSWYEGIQACKARSQSKTVVGQQLNGAQQRGIDSSQGDGMVNSKTVIVATETFTFTPVNTSTPTLDTTSPVSSSYTPDDVSITTSAVALMINTSTNTHSTHSSASKAITTHGYENLLKITIHVIHVLIVVFW